MKLSSKLRSYALALIVFAIVFGLSVLLRNFTFNVLGELTSGIIFRVFLLTGFAIAIIITGKGKWKLLYVHNLNRKEILLSVGVMGLFLINNLLMVKYGNKISYPSLGTAAFYLTIVQFLIGSVGEEVIYRGFIQTYINNRALSKLLPISEGNIFAGTLMTLTHLGFFMIMPTAFAVSSVLLVFIFSLSAGYLKDETGGIIAPVLLHLLCNAVHLLIHIA